MKPCHAWLLCGFLALGGCTTPALLRSQSPEEFETVLESKTRLIGDVARPYGDTYVKVEGVALVTGLPGTGEDPAPSPQRATLLHEMQTIGVDEPNQLLAAPSTALVLVRGFLPPGVQKGDRFDLEVQVPSHSETASLRGGWLMKTRLTEMALLGNQIHEGHLLALGEGPVLVDPAADGDKDRALLVRGRVLGGGVAHRSRSLGLDIIPEEKSVRISAQIGTAINKRFHTFVQGVKQGVAKPKTDEFIELAVHPRYKDNIGRYLRVVRSLPIKETAADRATRLAVLERQLLDPISAGTAALRLEAIGKDGVDILLKGLEAKDAEVRFYAAEALAYLDESKAAAPLADAARNEPAFRAHALAALSAMDDVAAYDELRNLLDVPSAETRYGAFRSLWAMRSTDPLVRGENLGGFSYHVLRTSGSPMIHVTRSYRPEIVLFGNDQRFETPLILDAGKSIMVNAQSGDSVTVSRFAIGQPDQKRIVSSKVDDVIRAIVELGGTYPDVVQALQQAKASRSLTSRFEVDAIPDARREFQRKADAVDEEVGAKPIEVSSPRPNLFSTKVPKSRR